MNELLQKYFELLQNWNRRINLTAINSESDFLIKHVEDSLALLPHIARAGTLLDLGTGAGIPGIILKIEKPEMEITLLDSTRKKISFCSEAIRKLSLPGIRAVCGRAEDIKTIEALGKFDVVVSRATWKIDEFIKMGAPYADDGGILIAMKGPDWREEFTGNKLSVEKELSYNLSNGDRRCLVIFTKETLT